MSCVGLAKEKSAEDREAEAEILRGTLREVGTKSVDQILKKIDRELWAHAPFFSKINETGVSFEVGVAGGAKAGPWGIFLITGTGISIAVDPKEKALVLEIYQDIEWTHRALPGYAGAEAFASGFLSATHHDWNEGLTPELGKALSLPGVAGCITRNNARIGVAKGIGVGFPGSAMLESNIIRAPVLRIGVSPKWTGFVRGKFFGSQFITGPLQWCATQIGNVCGSVYSMLSGSGEK
jgi:hypothetical protein